MTIYINNDYKCHTTNDDTMQEVETDFFDGKCNFFIEGYRYVPEGSTWTRSDGEIFTGVMIAPWKPYSILEAIQTEYEAMLAEMEDMQNALNLLGVTS